jgi:hypothetical protein
MKKLDFPDLKKEWDSIFKVMDKKTAEAVG